MEECHPQGSECVDAVLNSPLSSMSHGNITAKSSRDGLKRQTSLQPVRISQVFPKYFLTENLSSKSISIDSKMWCRAGC